MNSKQEAIDPPPRRTSYRRRTVSHQKSGGRRKRSGESALCTTIPFPIPKTLPMNWVLFTATRVIVDHLLYARGLIPMSVAQLKEMQQTEGQSPPSLKRKISQCHRNLEAFHQQWNSLLQSKELLARCSCVLISLGPSFSRAREYYLIQNNDKNFLVDATPEVRKLPPPLVLARRLLPKMMESDTTLPARSAPSYQIWVSLCLMEDTLETAWLTATENNPLMRWVQRPGFQPPAAKDLKPNQRMTCIQVSNNHQDLLTTNIDDASVGATKSGHWISAPTSIRGFRVHG